MANTAFDTLETAQNLEAAGVDTAQAEAHAREMAKAAQVELASKADIASIKADIADRETRLLWRFVTVMVAIAGLGIGLTQAFG